MARGSRGSKSGPAPVAKQHLCGVKDQQSEESAPATAGSSFLSNSLGYDQGHGAIHPSWAAVVSTVTEVGEGEGSMGAAAEL